MPSETGISFGYNSDYILSTASLNSHSEVDFAPLQTALLSFRL